MQKASRTEQETIIHYDVELDQWEIYSNYAPHIRKYRDKINPYREEFYADGTEATIDGVVEGSVSVRKKMNLSQEQRDKRAQRMRKGRK